MAAIRNYQKIDPSHSTLRTNLRKAKFGWTFYRQPLVGINKPTETIVSNYSTLYPQEKMGDCA